MGRRRYLTSVIRDRSLFIAWEGGGGRILGGDHLILGRKKRGESVVTSNPKGGITEKFGRIQRGATQIWLENKRMGEERGGDRENGQKLLGAITSVK